MGFERLLSKRIKNLPPYLFAEIDRIKEEKQRQGLKIIDLSIGDPDIPTPEPIVEAMREEVRKPEHHRYPSYAGHIALRKKFCEWYQGRFRVEFSPDEAIVLIGSKEGIAHLPVAFVDEGDTVVVPDPAYPVYGIWTEFCGGKALRVRLREEKGFLLDLEEIPADVLSRTKIVWLCYPNNPTTAEATEEYYDKVAFFARKYGFVVAVDLAYSEIYTDGKKPISFFEAVGKRSDVFAIEFHSFSKTFSMTGWRVAVAVGHRDVVSALGKVKTNTDSGVFQAIQFACIRALELYDSITPKIRQKYEERRRKMEEALQRGGFEFWRSNSTFYIWVRVKGGESSADFVKKLLEEHLILVTPGSGFGEGGEGWFRISLTASDKAIDEACSKFSEM